MIVHFPLKKGVFHRSSYLTRGLKWPKDATVQVALCVHLPCVGMTCQDLKDFGGATRGVVVGAPSLPGKAERGMWDPWGGRKFQASILGLLTNI
jgi:hypothetical protein